MSWAKNFLFCFCLLASSLNAQTKLPSFFANNMVLQQQTKVAIWGEDIPKTRVKINTSWGEIIEVVTNSNGKWSTTIPTKKASFKPETIFIRGSSTITLTNILIGEVWFCSGQSNMEMPLGGLRKSKVLNGQKYIDIANNNNIRLFNTPRIASVSPNFNTQGMWEVSNTEAAKKFSAIGYIFAIELYQKLNVPIGVIEASWGGTRIESWIPKRDLIKYEDIKFFDKLPEEKKSQKKPSFLYNAMIHPFQNYTIKGVLWYQGESNRTQPKPYKKYMKELIFSWRSQWKNDKLPFYVVQIAPYDYTKYKRGTPFRPNLIREAQLQTAQEIKNTGIVVTTDVGDCNDIHPSKKEIIAKRLSNWALANQYNFKDLSFKAAELKSFKIKDNKVNLKFQFYDNDEFLETEKTKGFAIAGVDKVFYPAKVEFHKNRKQIILSTIHVQRPVAVRYGFEACFESNLQTKSGLPIAVFRTDRWEE